MLAIELKVSPGFLTLPSGWQGRLSLGRSLSLFHCRRGFLLFLLRLRRLGQLSPLLVVGVGCCSCSLLISLPRLSQARLQCLLLQDPVVHEVEVEALSHEGLSEHRDKTLVVRPLLKPELARVVQKVPKLTWEARREVFDRSGCLFGSDLLVLVFLCLAWQALPRKAAPDEVHEHHSNLLEVVSSGLLDTLMRVKGSIACRSSQLLALLIANMPSCLGIFVPFSKAEIDDVDYMLIVTSTDQEVVRFNITVEKSTLVNKLYALNHLDGNHQDSLKVKLSATIFVDFLEARAQQVQYHHVVISRYAEVVHFWNSLSSVENAIQLVFVVQLREFRLCWFKLDCDFLIRFHV